MIAIRKQHPVFGHGGFDWAETDNRCGSRLLADWMRVRRLLVLNNLSSSRQQVSVSLPPEKCN